MKCPDTASIYELCKWRRDLRDIALARLKRTGCCGFEALQYSFSVECVNQHGVVFDRYTVTKCGITHEACPKREIGEVVKLFSILNGG